MLLKVLLIGTSLDLQSNIKKTSPVILFRAFCILRPPFSSLSDCTTRFRRARAAVGGGVIAW